MKFTVQLALVTTFIFRSSVLGILHACYEKYPSQPANSQQIFYKADRRTDALVQMFLCDFGYTSSRQEAFPAARESSYVGTNASFHMENIIVKIYCLRGVWSPTPLPTCLPRTSCFGAKRSTFDNLMVGQWNGSCYLIRQAPVWTLSRLDCINLGGDLVTIETLDEQLYLEDLLRAHMKVLGMYTRNFWIGLTKMQQDDWTWVTDGSKPTFTYWNDRAPTNTSKHYAFMKLENWYKGFAWEAAHDAGSEYSPSLRFSICEKKPDRMYYDQITVKRLTLIPSGRPAKLAIKGIWVQAESFYRNIRNAAYMAKLRVSSYESAKVITTQHYAFEASLLYYHGDGRQNPQTITCTNQSSKDSAASHCFADVSTDSYFHVNVALPTIYRLVAPDTQIEDAVAVMPVDQKTGSTEWMSWLPCSCDEETGRLQQWRFRICAKLLQPEEFTRNCTPSYDQPLRMEFRACTLHHEVGDSCSAKAREWGEWGSCSAPCGDATGEQHRTRLCLLNEALCDIAIEGSAFRKKTEARPCSADSCAPNDGLDIMELVRSDPDALYWMGGDLAAGGSPTKTKTATKSTALMTISSMMISLWGR